MIHQIVAEKTKFLRCQFDENVSRFSNTCGIKIDTLRNIERQTGRTPTPTLVQIAYNLAVRVEFFLDRDIPFEPESDPKKPVVVLARIGRNLRRIREEQGMSQHALAAAAGRHSKTIHIYEAGICVPSLVALEQLARALGVPITELFRPEGANTHEGTCTKRKEDYDTRTTD